MATKSSQSKQSSSSKGFDELKEALLEKKKGSFD